MLEVSNIVLYDKQKVNNMKRNSILTQKEGIGDIRRCACGALHIHIFYKGISMSFPEEAFFAFASMVKEGASVLMDEYLADLTMGGDAQKEESI